ncbi:MAG TPA: c-type cytochrome [Candidatus Thioglobus sp.]|jgi:cytochrome c oxidase cbb3-type subunit 3|nr:c-type cytochrome [Candidatus Thioglobus sp.]HIL77280.1 c-type cytochrome [Rhodospirillales bacterium]
MKRLKNTFYMLALLSLTSQSYAQGSAQHILEGEQLYNRNCVFCHQADAIGKPGRAPSLANDQLLSISSDKFLFETIRNGRAGTSMIPFRHVNDESINKIIIYLRSLSTAPNRSKEVNAQPESHGDPRLGKVWFDYVCSTCHGFKGDGYAAGSTGTAIGNKGFLDLASDGFLRETIKYGRTGTRMYGFKGPKAMANLTDSEIEDIIAYMRTL